VWFAGSYDRGNSIVHLKRDCSLLVFRAVIKRVIYGGLLVLCLNGQTYAQGAEVVLVGQEKSVEFNKIYELILKDAGIQYEILVVPMGRKRRMFVEGKILIDCCTVPEWRSRPEEIANQTHSVPFYNSAEQYVFHKDKPIQIVSRKDLKNYRLSIVRGYFYRNERYFGEVIGAENTEQMIRLVAHKRVEIGIINPFDFKRLQMEAPLPLRLDGVHEISPLSIRVHKNRPDLLERINGVIEQYLARGYVEEILGQAIERKTE